MAITKGLIHMRRARRADARAIAEVHVDTWRHAYRDLLPIEFLNALSAEARERYWASELAVTPGDRTPWLADSAGQVAGFASVGPSRDADAQVGTGELYTLYVMPEMWDRGVGADLLRRAEHDLIDHDYAEATLWVLADNARARRFYERAGWRTDGAERIECIGEVRLREVRYRKVLQPSRVG
jgi:ribosomal protein S18 acetylase RimI-like enzyme